MTLYKSHHTICFYDYDTDEFLYQFDTVKDILKFQGKPITQNNVVLINVNLYRSLRREDNYCRFLIKGKKMRVYMIDNNDEEEN